MNRSLQLWIIPSMAALLLAAGQPSATHAAIKIKPLALQGDAVAGVGNITAFSSISVNNKGDWFVEADTDHADTLADAVMLNNGVVAFRENHALTVPAGANISSFDSTRINSASNAGWNLFLRNVPTTLDSGVFFNTTLVIRESDIATAPQFSPNTPYIGFFEVRMNTSNQMMVVASVDDPAIATTVDRALVIVNYDAKLNTHTETVLYKEGDILPGQTEAVADFGTSEISSAFNNSGDVLFTADLAGDTTVDTVLYLNNTLLVREGSPSPSAKRNYLNVNGNALDLSNNDDWVLRVSLSGDTTTDLSLIRNNTLFKSEGDAPPGVGGGVTLSSFGTGGVEISDNADVAWYGQWTGDTTTNQGLFVEDTLLVRKGVTQINSMTLTTVAGTTATGGIASCFDASPNGRYIGVLGLLNATTRVAFMIDRCPGDVFPNPDGTVEINIDDLVRVITNWDAKGDNLADVNGDGVVNIDDLVIVITTWGPCP